MEEDLSCESAWNKLQKIADTFPCYLGSMLTLKDLMWRSCTLCHSDGWGTQERHDVPAYLEVGLVWQLSLTDFPFDAIDVGKRSIIEKVSCEGSLREGVVFEGWSNRLHFPDPYKTPSFSGNSVLWQLVRSLGKRHAASFKIFDDWLCNGKSPFDPSLERYHLHWSFMSALEAPSCWIQSRSWRKIGETKPWRWVGLG